MRNIIKNKKGDVFGMSFSMIFSILLIIFFIAAAFVAIKFFLNFSGRAQVGLFFSDLRDEVSSIWQSQNAVGYTFNSTLPSGIDYVCFANFSAPAANSNSWEESLLYEVKRGKSGLLNKNIVLYPPSKAYDLGYNQIEKIKLPDSNPYCIEVKDGKVSITLDKTFDDALVRIG